MTRIEQVLNEFIDAWSAGHRPDVDEHLARVPAGERDALAAQLLAWLRLAPPPAYDDAARAQLGREPLLRAAFARAAARRAPLAERLPPLRERAGLAVHDVAERLAARFGFDDTARAARYLEQLERGELDATRVSRRLLDALAAILDAEPGALVAPTPPATAGGVLFRATQSPAQWQDDIEAISRAALAPAPPPMDELDRLFLGGADA